MSNRKPRQPATFEKRAASLSALACGSALLGVVAVAWADVPPSPHRADAAALLAAPPAAQAAPAPLASFLRDYHRALVTGNRRFLAEHTAFPLPFSELVYDMEAKIKASKLTSIGELLKSRQSLRWPQLLVPQGAADLARLRRGAEKCMDPNEPATPDYAQGEPAIELHGETATLTYLAEPCAAETHMVTLSFVRSGQLWQLRERAARRGNK